MRICCQSGRPGRRLRLHEAGAIFCILVGRIAADVVVLNDDGAWNWLQDPRAIIVNNQLVVGSVAMGHRDVGRAGDVDVTSYDLRTGQRVRATVHREAAAEQRRRWKDDHSCPALIVRPDGRIVAMYSTHAQEPTLRFRVTRRPDDVSEWGDEQMFTTAEGSRVTFPTLIHLANENDGKGRLLAFFRGLNNRGMPSLAHSDDAGHTWQTDGVFLQWPEKRTPYVKYVSDGRAAVHFAFTDGHRIDFNNALFHACFRDGQLWRTNGERIGSFADGISSAQQPTEIFRCNPDSVAMISDLEIDAKGWPCVVYSVQMNTRPLRPRPIGADHRYRYARWDGRQWLDFEIAYAGTEVHSAPDDDCTGLAAIDPQDINKVYLSTNADPSTGAPLVSKIDQQRHWEIFQGITRDGGSSWTWKAITRDSKADNLRPMVLFGGGYSSAVIWLRGTMRMPKDSSLEVVMVTP
jgi:hypothetical protein